MSDDAIVVVPGSGERFDRGNRVVTIVADLPQMCVAEIEFEESFEVPLHLHDDHVDSFYVLEGEIEFVFADHTVTAGPGTFVAAPPGVLHGFRTRGPRRARMLNVHTPNAGFAVAVRAQK
jgi:mannose-6-phosphate isomerase-like protein (cupin superfamily)